jgi:hypothetical protein
MKVQNMTSKNGKKVPNQFVITDGNIEYFQSYKTIIAKRDHLAGIATIDIKNPYSKTTSKYLYMFLGTNSKDFRIKLNNGAYLIADLNK